MDFVALSIPPISVKAVLRGLDESWLFAGPPRGVVLAGLVSRHSRVPCGLLRQFLEGVELNEDPR